MDDNDKTDEAVFEEMFKDRFTEKDEEFMQVKSRGFIPPPVIYPWKMMQKRWNKRWDHFGGRQEKERSERERTSRKDYRHQKHSSHDRHRDRSGGETSSNYHRDNSHDKHEDRSGKKYRDRSSDRSSSSKNRNYEQNYRDRSHHQEKN